MSVRVSESINHFNLLTNMLFVLNNMFFFYILYTMASDFNFYLQIDCFILTCLKKECYLGVKRSHEFTTESRMNLFY